MYAFECMRSETFEWYTRRFSMPMKSVCFLPSWIMVQYSIWPVSIHLIVQFNCCKCFKTKPSRKITNLGEAKKEIGFLLLLFVCSVLYSRDKNAPPFKDLEPSLCACVVLSESVCLWCRCDFCVSISFYSISHWEKVNIIEYSNGFWMDWLQQTTNTKKWPTKENINRCNFTSVWDLIPNT